jgi:uncharacterized protein (TIGR02246 family)
MLFAFPLEPMTFAKRKELSPMRQNTNMLLVALLLALFGSTLAAAKNVTADEQAIRDIDTAWSKAAGAKDLDKTVSVYADDASMLPPNAPIANGKDAIRAAWSQLMALPGFSLSFVPSKVTVSKSRDIAYEIGTFQLTVNDAQGKPAASIGKFVVVWERRGGQWKAVADIFNDDK